VRYQTVLSSGGTPSASGIQHHPSAEQTPVQ
jgi:hypothetical protein